MLPINFWLLFAVCMLVSSIGFKNYVWFISLGYGFSIAAEGLVMLILYGQSLSIGTIVCCVLFILAFAASMGMGAMSGQDVTQAWVNWVEQGINCAGQGMLMWGVLILHKAGLKDFQI